jgi:hypothetical protein
MDLSFYSLTDVESELDRHIASLGNYSRSKSLRPGSMVTMIVFTGGSGAAQESLVRRALNDLVLDLRGKRLINLEVTYLNQDTVKNIYKWGPAELTDHMLTFDIHICPTHPHQGNIGNKKPEWNVNNIYRHVDRWAYHLGFFSGRYCRCPVLTQNKKAYLELLPDICLPSIYINIPLKNEIISREEMLMIERFVNEIGSQYGDDFCCKLGYVTHRLPKYGIGVRGILTAIYEYARQEETQAYYPYIIVQPR